MLLLWCVTGPSSLACTVRHVVLFFARSDREGNELFKSKDFRAAIKCYTEAIDIDGSNHVLFGNRRYDRLASSSPTNELPRNFLLKALYD